MSKAKKLSKRQIAVLNDLFDGELEEKAVLERHQISRGSFEEWFADERFARQFEQRIARAHRESRMILARHAPKAANRLVELTHSQAGETARKACLDIIPQRKAAGSKSAREAPPAPAPATPLSPETAGRLLAALAQEPQENDADCG